MMRFVEVPWLLACIPVWTLAVTGLLVYAVRRRAARLGRLGSASLVARLVPPAAARSPRQRMLLLGGAATCMGLAFAGPRWGVEQNVIQSSGVDLVLALDASLSMLATDERPSRLERLKEEARRLVASSPGDRIGLIAFAGRSYILTPLTVDRGALELFLDNLDPNVVGQAGTSLARAIRQGTELLTLSKSGADRALVIMSDGEAFEPRADIVDAARAAADAGVALVTVGFGTTAGSTIPVVSSGGRTLKRDGAGNIVVTHYEPDLLRAAADAAHGTFIDAAATDKAERVRRALATLRRTQQRADAGRNLHPRFQLFLLPALILLLADTLLAERYGRRRRTAAAATTAPARAAAALLLALGLPQTVWAAGWPSATSDGERFFRAGRYVEAAAAYARAVQNGDTSATAYYNLGTALLAAGRTEDAVQSLEHAAQSRQVEVRYRALFNLGLVYLKRARALTDQDAATQAYTAAADLYKRALRLRPRDFDAKWNYELALHKSPPPKGGGGGGGGGSAQHGSPPAPQNQQNRPAGGLDERQAEQLLESAARDERDVQGRKQKQNQVERPPGGKDW